LWTAEQLLQAAQALGLLTDELRAKLGQDGEHAAAGGGAN